MNYTIIGTPQLPETLKVIDYLVNTYPLPLPVEFVFKKDKFQIEGLPCICDGSMCSPRGKVQLIIVDTIIPGERGRQGIIHTLLHEYKHGLQIQVEGRVYNYPWDEELEKEANGFAWKELEKLKRRKLI